jgi:hypothetical protein
MHNTPERNMMGKYCTGLHYIMVWEYWAKFISAFGIKLVCKVCVSPVLMSLNVLSCLSHFSKFVFSNVMRKFEVKPGLQPLLWRVRRKIITQLKSQWYMHVPSAVTFTNYAFCSQSIYGFRTILKSTKISPDSF